jgi:hypothetical protein
LPYACSIALQLAGRRCSWLFPANGVLVHRDVQGSAILLCIAVAMFCCHRVRDRLSVSLAMMFVVAEVVLITLRFYIAYFVILAALATFVFGQRAIPS